MAPNDKPGDTNELCKVQASSTNQSRFPEESMPNSFWSKAHYVHINDITKFFPDGICLVLDLYTADGSEKYKLKDSISNVHKVVRVQK